MPPSTTATSSSTPQIWRSAAQRCGHGVRSAAGPLAGSRWMMKATPPISNKAHSKPGSTPAANSLPIFVSVTMP